MTGEREFVLPSGRRLPLVLRRSRRARRLRVTVSPVDGRVELVLPQGAALEDGLAFVDAKRRWIERRRSLAPGRAPFVDGAVLPFLGASLRIRRAPLPRGRPRREGGELLVPGGEADLARSVGAWLRQAAQEEIAPRVADKSARLGRTPGPLAIRDTRTRWGSCSAHGSLSFSWRLVLAPEPVLDYVVAHEVAHLAEMNHGPRFWAHVAALCRDPAGARAWLRANGPALHRYG